MISSPISFDDSVPLILKEIGLLREYRTRLISDVVTGQIDVRGIEIPDYIPVEDVDSDGESEEEGIRLLRTVFLISLVRAFLIWDVVQVWNLSIIMRWFLRQ